MIIDKKIKITQWCGLLVYARQPELEGRKMRPPRFAQITRGTQTTDATYPAPSLKTPASRSRRQEGSTPSSP